MQEALPAKPALQRSRSAGTCAAEANACRPGKRLFGIVGEDQSEWQPLLRESSQVACPPIFTHMHTRVKALGWDYGCA